MLNNYNTSRRILACFTFANSTNKNNSHYINFYGYNINCTFKLYLNIDKKTSPAICALVLKLTILLFRQKLRK